MTSKGSSGNGKRDERRGEGRRRREREKGRGDRSTVKTFVS